MQVRRHAVAIGVGLAALVAVLPAPVPAGAAAAPPQSVRRAVAFLRGQQQPDGGFELAQFPGFETPDAVIAFAAAAQTGPTWSTAAARSAVSGVRRGGRSPLDLLDDLVDREADPNSIAAGARAAKVVALVANPLGISPTDFDPSNDSAAPVDLLARIARHARPDGSYDFAAQFNGALYAVVALQGAGRGVPDGVVAQIRAAQNGDGSWDFSGRPRPTGNDIDTTAMALIALHAAGRTTADATVRKGVAYLAARQQPDGAWLAFGDPDPNATAMAALALSAQHVDLSAPTWAGPFGVARRSSSPFAWLTAQQDPASGRFRSPSDASGVTTFATSQATQALAMQWYLAPDRRAYVEHLARTLGSPDASPTVAAAGVASDAFGPNAALAGARAAAARAVLSSSAGRDAAAADLFQRAFGRTIDASGRAYWSKQLARISRPEMLSRLTGSNEFYRAAGGTTPTFVDAVFRSVLGRAPEPAGRAYWIGRLDRGTAVEAVARSLVASSEYRRQQVDAAYREILGRAPDAASRASWTTRLATVRVEELLVSLASSREAFDRA